MIRNDPYPELINCCKVLTNNWPYPDPIIDTISVANLKIGINNWLHNYNHPKDLPRNATSKECIKWEKNFFENKAFKLPPELEKLNILIYSVDWKNILNPFIISRLSLIMDFTVSPSNIFGEDFIIKFLKDYLNHPYNKYKSLMNDNLIHSIINELKGKNAVNTQVKISEELFQKVVNDVKAAVVNNSTYPSNYEGEFTPKLYKLTEKQAVLNYRIHLVDTYADCYAIIISSRPIPHDVAQLMYEYYTWIYGLINDDFFCYKGQKPKNGIYLYFTELTFIEQYSETGNIMSKTFIETQKKLRKQVFN